MYKLTSTSNSTLSFQIVEGGKCKAVRLMPKAHCFTETLSEQINNLQRLRALRVKEVVQNTPPKESTSKEITPKEVTLKDVTTEATSKVSKKTNLEVN